MIEALAKWRLGMYNYNIRAHHGMCLAFFKGEGYSSEFTGHMKHMKRLLNENTVVRIVSSVDDICLCCPHNLDGVCEESRKTEEYDKRVLELCSLKEDSEIGWKEFENLVWKRILSEGLRKDICGDCEWNAICSVNNLNRKYY